MNQPPQSISDVTPLILAGGLGTRLRSVLVDRPKPLAPINGRPFLSYLLDQLLDAGFKRAVLCTGYRSDLIEATFGNRYRGLDLEYSRETSPLGTAGAIRLALAHATTDTLLIMNGDSFCHADLPEFVCWYFRNRYSGAMLLTEVSDCDRYGRVVLGANNRINAFLEKNSKYQAGLINAGIYLFQRQIFETLHRQKLVSLEQDLIPKLLVSGMYGLVFPGSFIDIGTPKSFKFASKFFEGRTAVYFHTG